MPFPDQSPVAFIGGPHCGQEHVSIARTPGLPMPEELPSQPRYRLHAVDTRVRPQRWIYVWTHEPRGVRRRCEAFHGRCTAAGCPSRKAKR